MWNAIGLAVSISYDDNHYTTDYITAFTVSDNGYFRKASFIRRFLPPIFK